MTEPAPQRHSVFAHILGFFDTHHGADPAMDTDQTQGRPDWLRVLPFLIIHVACLLVFVPAIGYSAVAIWFAVAWYWIRMFAITGIYHRYFSHRTYRTSRVMQFLFGVLGNAAVQRGPLWWAAHHRHHHRYSDEVNDIHSPLQRGFWWSHMVWFMTGNNYRTRLEAVPDLAKFPELVWLDRFDVVVPILTAAASFALGAWLQHLGWQTSGLQFLVFWCISTVCVAHATFTINSLSHVWGWRRYATSDTSRNNPFLAILTMGEGWHNNHHHYQSSVRQSHRWYEIDCSFYIIKAMSWLGLVWDLKPVPAKLWSPRSVTAAEAGTEALPIPSAI